MNRAIVRCHCGHQVLSKEVLRTDLYERRSSDGSAEYVCVRYRCRRCRRLGEAFVAEKLWDWSALELDNSELSEDEREVFRKSEPISEEDIKTFHDELETLHLFLEAGDATANEVVPDNAAAPTDSAADASTRASAETPPRDTPREPRSAAPKPPEKPAPNAARGDQPRGDNP